MKIKTIALFVALSSLVACGGSKQDENINDAGSILVTRTTESGQEMALISGVETPEQAQQMVESGQVSFQSADQFQQDEELGLAPAQTNGNLSLAGELARNNGGRGQGRRNNGGRGQGRRFNNRGRGNRGNWRPYNRRQNWGGRRYRGWRNRPVRSSYYGWNNCGYNSIYYRSSCYQPRSTYYNNYSWQPQYGYATTYRNQSSYVRFWF